MIIWWSIIFLGSYIALGNWAQFYLHLLNSRFGVRPLDLVVILRVGGGAKLARLERVRPGVRSWSLNLRFWNAGLIAAKTDFLTFKTLKFVHPQFLRGIQYIWWLGWISVKSPLIIIRAVQVSRCVEDLPQRCFMASRPLDSDSLRIHELVRVSWSVSIFWLNFDFIIYNISLTGVNFYSKFTV